MSWIEEEERKDREAAALEAAKEAETKKEEEWMLAQLKKEHGDDFGDDVNLNFSE